MKKYLMLGVVILLFTTACGNSKEVKLCKELKKETAASEKILDDTTNSNEIVKPEEFKKETERIQKYLDKYYKEYCTEADFEICKDIELLKRNTDMWNDPKYGAATVSGNLVILETDCGHVLGEDK